jgi:hypothetical protein
MLGKYLPAEGMRFRQVGIPFPLVRQMIDRRRPAMSAGRTETPLNQRHDTGWHA